MSISTINEFLFNAAQLLDFENYKPFVPNGDDNNFMEWEISPENSPIYTAKSIFNYEDGDVIKKACITVSINHNKMKVIDITKFIPNNKSNFF